MKVTRACVIEGRRGRTRQGAGDATWGDETALRLLDDQTCASCHPSGNGDPSVQCQSSTRRRARKVTASAEPRELVRRAISRQNRVQGNNIDRAVVCRCPTSGKRVYRCKRAAVHAYGHHDGFGASRAIRDRQHCKTACDPQQEAPAAERCGFPHSFPHSFFPLIRCWLPVMSMRQIASVKQRRSSLCPCPHRTVIPAAIPERIKR